MDNRPATIFCDIDGTLVIHSKPTDAQLPSHQLNLLDGTIEKLLEWDKLGYNIILTTGRKESLRNVTRDQLEKVGIIYDIGGGKRYLINDFKENNNEPYAYCVNVKRNSGIKNINI